MNQIVGMIIGLVAVVMGIGVGMLAIYCDYRRRREMFELHHKERMAAIEKGIELPPLPEAFFSPDGRAPRTRKPNPHAKLLGGLLCLFLGIALSIAVYFAATLEAALFSLTLPGVGLALLIYYFMVDKPEIEARKAGQSLPAAGTGKQPAAS
jgi:hypothetical protein